MAIITFHTVSTENEIEEIIKLQSANLELAVKQDEIVKEGFVTCVHSKELLLKMNTPFPHSIAKFEEKVIGYALAMLPSFKNALAVLQPMFNKIEQVSYKDEAIKPSDYFVMGQVCIAVDFRKQGIFRKLYTHLLNNMKLYFNYCITEVAKRNVRSLQAHKAIGFMILTEYEVNEEEWAILIYELTD